TWRKPDGTTVTTDTLKIASLKLSDAGFYRLTVRDSRGCRNQDSIKYTVNALPKITVSGDSKLCTGSTLKLNVTGTINYRWTGPNGFLSFAANPTKTGVTMLDSGLYTVIGTNANLCRDTATWNVMINPAIPGLKIFGDSQVCLWEKLTLSTIANTKNYRYKWRTPNAEVYYNPKLVIPLNKQSYEGVYSVVVSDSNYYCKDSVTDYVWVGPRPMSSASNSPICAGDTLKLNAYGNSRWTWQWSGPQGFTSTSINPKLAYATTLDAGSYRLIGKDTLGCTDTLTENVKINDCLLLEVFSDSVKCKGGSSGLARVVARGGSGFYQYRWLTNPVRFDDSLKNVPKGTYTVVVTDAKTGIVRIDSIKVGEPAAILTTSITIDSLICRDSSNAKLTCKASGGTTPYGYKWNGNVLLNNSVLQKVGVGSHSVVVTDRRGCMDTADVTVVNPKRWVITKSRDNVLCAGGNTGQASIVVSGGKPAYFYQWDTVTWVSKTKAISSVYKNLKAGIYKVLITDANNCQQTDTVMIAQPDSIKVSFTIDNYIRCYGDTSGQITSFPKGGVAGYTYLWNYNKKYTAKVAKNLPAGWYVLQLRDGNNCLKVDSILLSQPDDIKTKVSVLTHLKCYKDKSGAAEVSVTGGVTPYYVKWDNGGYTAQGFARNYMDAGDHWVYIRDFQGCYDTLKLTLNQPDSIITLFKTRRNVLCYNGNTGWAEFELAGGKAPFTYVWENGNTTKRATGLQATSYWMRAVDSNGCKYTDTIQMAQPPELDVYVKRMDSVTCFGLSDGRAELSAVGGKKPYGFWYFTGKDTVKGPNLTGVPARQFPAKYDGYVRDSNGCVDYTPVFIKEPLKLQVKRNGQVELICYGAATASVAVGPMGGNGGYTYSWNSFPKQYNAIATKLKAGVYIVTLKDYKGCTALDTFTIKQPAKNPIVTNPMREFCLKRTMNLTAAQFGADTAWWYNPAGLYIGNAYPTFTKPNVTLSDSGNYTLIVKDKQGCNDTAKIKVIVHKLPVVSAWIQQPAPHCKSDTITFRSSGAVNYSWNGPNGFMSSVQNPVISGLTLPMDGWYYVQGTDNNTCQSRDSVRLNIENNISIAKNQDICAGSNLVLSGFGAEKYRWSGPHGYGSTLQSPIIMDVEDSMSGRYTLFARDKYGCKDTLFTDILIYPRPYINPNANEPVCAGEPLSLFSKGGGNYQYTWTGPLGYSSTSANPVINTSTQSQTGNYNVYASYQADAVNVCRDSAFVYAQVFGLPVSAFMLTPKSAVYLTETEYELVDFSKNAVSWTYYMDDNYLANGPNAKFTLTEAGVRVFKQVVQSKDVSVYSAGYCTDSSDQVVKIEYKPKLWMPNAFTPNNNNKNDLLYPVGVNITEYRLRIFDQWGSKIFDELNGKWSGYDVNDKPYPVGVYIVYVTYKDITGLERELKNNVTLLR
ncbi:MAG: gliding motility-associated C-terminal domain-containing protein, partial [Sphingomonadales bacterium]